MLGTDNAIVYFLTSYDLKKGCWDQQKQDIQKRHYFNYWYQKKKKKTAVMIIEHICWVIISYHVNFLGSITSWLIMSTVPLVDQLNGTRHTCQARMGLNTHSDSYSCSWDKKSYEWGSFRTYKEKRKKELERMKNNGVIKSLLCSMPIHCSVFCWAEKSAGASTGLAKINTRTIFQYHWVGLKRDK